MYELLCLNHDTIGAENLIKNSLLFVHCPNVDIMTDDVIQVYISFLVNLCKLYYMLLIFNFLVCR